MRGGTKHPAWIPPCYRISLEEMTMEDNGSRSNTAILAILVIVVLLGFGSLFVR